MRKIYIPNITGKERRLLKKIYKRCKGKISYRAHIILLAVELLPEYTVEQIAAICWCTRQTVYNVFEKFNENRIIGLLDDQRSGRPRKINSEVSVPLLELLETKTPREVGNYLHGKWTLKLTVDYVKNRWQIKVSPRSISRWLQQNGWEYNRSKNEFKVPGPLSKKEQKDVIKLLKIINEEKEVLLFIDQSAFYLDGIPSGFWGPKGTQKRVYNYGNKKKFWVFGAFNPHTKKVYYRVCEGCNSAELRLFLYQIRQRFPGKIIHLVLDKASFHTSQETSDFFKDHQDFVPHFLPTKGARLNPIERFWQFAKGIVTASSIFTDMKELYHVLRQFFWYYASARLNYNFDKEKLIVIWQNWPVTS
ncbi:MAG: IS630 family transposase [Candidatus Brocadiae bacterium]|nr:IS630 family transposase [Candidatus Brocadiia bacterium]